MAIPSVLGPVGERVPDVARIAVLRANALGDFIFILPALEALRSVAGCERAAEVAEVRAEPPGMVLVETAFGGRRVMDLLAGDPLPRIC